MGLSFLFCAFLRTTFWRPEMDNPDRIPRIYLPIQYHVTAGIISRISTKFDPSFYTRDKLLQSNRNWADKHPSL